MRLLQRDKLFLTWNVRENAGDRKKRHAAAKKGCTSAGHDVESLHRAKRNHPTGETNETTMQRFQVFIRLTNGNIGHIEQSDYTLADAMESALDLFGSRFIACFPM